MIIILLLSEEIGFLVCELFRDNHSTETNHEDITLSTVEELEPADVDQNSDNLPIALRKNRHNCVKPHPNDIALSLNYNRLSLVYKVFFTSLDWAIIPKTAVEALKYPHWKKSINEEIDALIKSKTWEIVDLPRDKKKYGLDGFLQ